MTQKSYGCPRCGKPVTRGGKADGVAGAAGGVIGVLLESAAGSYNCPTCGKISIKEFPSEIQRKEKMSSLIMVGIALVLVALLIVYRIYSADSGSL